MASDVETKQIGDIILWEGDMRYSREMVTVKTGATILIGEVCGDSTGITPLVADAGTPSDTAATVIALEAITSAGAGAQILCAVRMCIYNKDQVTYGAATTVAQADTALKALGMIAYEEPGN